MRFFGQHSGDDFLPSVTTLVSGTSAAMALTYMARPVLTRLYTPEMFGLLGVFTAIVAVLTTISSGRYDDAVMLPEDDRKARSVLFLGFTLLIGLSLVTIPVAVFSDAVAGAVGKPQLAPYLILVPVSLFFMGTVRLAEVWLTRARRFRTIAGGRATQSAVAVPIQLASGISGATPWGLIAGLVCGQAAAAVALAGMGFASLRGFVRPRLSELRSLAIRYRDFPLFSGPSALLNSVSSQLPAFLLFLFFDAGVVGHYAQAYALLAVPIGLVGSSVAQVYFVKAARTRAEGGLDALTEKVFRRLFELGIFPMIVVLIAGPEIVGFILGPAWETAGMYAQLLAVWLLFLFVSSPLTRLFDVLERLRANLAFNVLLFVTRLVVLVIAGTLGDALLAVALYGATSAVLYLGLLVWLLVLAEVRIWASARFAVRCIAISAVPAFAVAAAVARFSPGVIFVVAILSTIAYGALVVALHRRTDGAG